MIYKNDERYDLTKEDKKEVFKFLGWENKNGELENPHKPRLVNIVHPESYYKWDKANKRMRYKPHEFTFKFCFNT